MQAGAPYIPPDCQTYPGGQKRVLIKKTALKSILSAHFFEQISLPAALSVVERQLFCRCITNTTQPHISLYEKNPRCSSLCFRLQCQRLRSGSRRSGGVPRPRCPEVLQERQKVPQEMRQGRQMPRKMRPALQQRGKALRLPQKGRSPQGLTQRTVNINKNPCRNLPARVFSAGRGQPHPFR